MPQPKIDAIEPFSEIEKLHFEKEVVGVYISGHPLDNFKFEMDTFTNVPIVELNDLDSKEGKDCKVAGIVAAVEHRLTKTGKPFGKLAIEDYSGKYEFTLWSEDYLKYKSFLMPGIFLFIEGSVSRKAWGDMSLEFKIRSVDLLNEIGVKRAKGMQIKMDTNHISTELIDQIEKLCAEFNGTCPLYLKIQDEGEKVNLELLSRKFRVKPVNEMMVKFKKIKEVSLEVVA
jgi:DNA polymerase-3 subunit alpha